MRNILSGRAERLLHRLRLATGFRAFEALYGSLAPFYDHISRFFFAGQWAVWQQSALEHLRGRDVLELGYGTGELILELCRRGYEPVGVDLSPRMRLIAGRKLRRHGCAAQLLLGSSTGLPLPDGSFDTIISTFPSAYIADARTWEEAGRVLRPGGRVVVVLSGELLPVDHRSRLLIRFHRLVYGRRQSPTELRWPPIPGFELSHHTHATEGGIAHLLLADKSA